MRLFLFVFLIIFLAVLGATFLFSLQGGQPGWQGQESLNGVAPAKELLFRADRVVEIGDKGFAPQIITIRKGETVVWVNKGAGYYWPASNIHPTHKIYPELDPLEPLAPGEAWAFTFEQTGEWRLHDHLRPSKGGTVRVTE